ncbi:swr complex subunit [Coemansia sp. Benny D115]|nr:swr complex subunit [Coemansia sp. Benny D115]
MFTQKTKANSGGGAGGSGMSRELHSLYLENQTLPVPLDLFQAKPRFDTRAERWVWRAFQSSARNDDLALQHWAKASEQYSDYYYARYNAKANPYSYTDDEYKSCIEQLDTSWTREETDYLFYLCGQFDLRFIVIHDRYYQHPSCPRGVKERAVAAAEERSLEDLKDRYYAICRTLTQARAGEDSRDPDDLPLQATNKLADDLALLAFDKTRELERKHYLEALFGRTKEEIEEEEFLVVEARRIEASERRLIHEREALLSSHAMFDEAPASATIPVVKVQFAQAVEPPQTPMTPMTPGVTTAGEPGSSSVPKVRKSSVAAESAAGVDSGSPGVARPLKKQKSLHAAPSTPKNKTPVTKASSAAGTGSSSVKAALAASVAAGSVNAGDGASGRASSSVVRSSMSPGRASSIGAVKHEPLDQPTHFGSVTFATEEHLVYPAVVQIDTPETGPITIAQRDARLGPGVFLRSDKLHPIPKNKLDAVKQFMSQLSLSSPNTIWPRPVMATAAVCDRFDSLQSTIIPLLDCKKTADKLETELQVLRARKRMQVNEIGEAKAAEILSKLPPIDLATVASSRATPPLTPLAESAPASGAGRHNRKGSTASSRKKAARE